MTPDEDTPAFDLFEYAIGEACFAEDYDSFRLLLETRLRNDAGGIGLVDSTHPRDPRDEHDGTIAACLLSRAVWNVTPRPSNDFRPDPVTEPGRNDACRASLACKVKQCCGSKPKPPTLDAEFVWSVLLDQLSPDEIADALERKRVPARVAPLAASILVDEDPPLARGVLEARYDGSLDRCDEHDAQILLLLCDAYDALKAPDDKAALLERMIQSRSLDARTDALQRRATFFADRGDFAAAWVAFREAERTIPDDIFLAPLELSLLVGEGRLDDAKRRADELHKEFTEAGFDDDYPDLMAMFEQAKTDPVAAVAPPEPSEPTLQARPPNTR